ncbi:MAG: tetratricopeptide repeat protein [Gemmatimonadota bacterium]|nr:tetratricopeptide repeat protein [Gemmatimonadota bacterium]MDP6802073.1 tetratricopeptide repeat protein [Gemmatimonadota bacterium]MDP7032453.1 tetratricopeptide repeat protein [Gemmatimonadota bacterium]
MSSFEAAEVDHLRPVPPILPGLNRALPDLESSLAEDSSARNVVKVAEANWMSGRLERAMELLEELVSGNADTISGRVLLGWCYDEAGRGEDRRRIHEEALALDPDNARLVSEPGSGRARCVAPSPSGRTEAEAEPEAALTEKELEDALPTPLYSGTLAGILERQGFDGKALEIYEAVVREYPDREDLRMRIQELRSRDTAEGEPS